MVRDETVTIADATDTLTQDRVAVAADGHHRREGEETWRSATGQATPQPFVPPLAETE